MMLLSGKKLTIVKLMYYDSHNRFHRLSEINFGIFTLGCCKIYNIFALTKHSWNHFFAVW